MQAARGAHVPFAITLAVAASWTLAVVAQVSGSATLLHHHTLIERGPPLPVALLLFTIAWLVMIAAMMLPSSLPLIRLFAVTSANQPRPGVAMGCFVAGYAIVWSAFGVLAFCADVGLHRTVDNFPWLSQRPWIIGAAVLALAGGFQFSRLKDQCLRVCRSPANFLMRYYRRGAREALEIGYRHGLFCAGCCWALMLVGFAAGFASLWWMAALTALMIYEKTAAGGRRAVPIAGGVLLSISAVMLLHPPWLTHWL
jgi:predicted metal-binding membrane protein